MRESVVQNALRLQRSALALVIIGNLKLIILQLLTLLFHLPRLLFPSHSVLLVQRSRMMSLPALQNLLMTLPLPLPLHPTPIVLREVVVVSALDQMRELVLVAHAEAKG
jgi:hypothetical protein